MVNVKCAHCGKRKNIRQYRKSKSGNNYCNASCQLNYEYDNNVRDKFLVTKKAQEAAVKRMHEDNWLMYPENRDKLREVMQSDEYRLKSSLLKRGEKNPMFGKIPANFRGFNKRYDRYRQNRVEWNKIREEMLHESNHLCAECSSKDNLQVHHLIPFYISEDNSKDNLIVLCAKCHMKHEPRRLSIKNIKRIIKPVKVYNFEVDEDESYTAEDIIVHNCRCVIELRPN